MDITPLAEAQAALKNIVTILSTMQPSDENVWYEIDRAIGTAKLALIMWRRDGAVMTFYELHDDISKPLTICAACAPQAVAEGFRIGAKVVSAAKCDSCGARS